MELLHRSAALGPFHTNLHNRITICIKKITQSYFCHEDKRKIQFDDFLYAYIYAAMQVCMEWPVPSTGSCITHKT